MAADIPLLIASANSSSERRITPAWTVAHFKARLEPITGIPASAQRLTVRTGSQEPVIMGAADEEATTLATFALQPYAEIYVSTYARLGPESQQNPVMSTFSFPSLHERRMEACHMCCLDGLRGSSMPHPGRPSIGSSSVDAFLLTEASAACCLDHGMATLRFRAVCCVLLLFCHVWVGRPLGASFIRHVPLVSNFQGH